MRHTLTRHLQPPSPSPSGAGQSVDPFQSNWNSSHILYQNAKECITDLCPSFSLPFPPEALRAEMGRLEGQGGKKSVFVRSFYTQEYILHQYNYEKNLLIGITYIKIRMYSQRVQLNRG